MAAVPHKKDSDRTLKILLVGGEPGRVDRQFRQPYREMGMEIVEHWSWKKMTADRLPSECDAVVVLSSLTNHLIDSVAVKLAKGQRLPFVRVHHKLSRARPILKSAGFIRNGVAGPSEVSDEPDEIKTAILVAMIKGGEETGEMLDHKQVREWLRKSGEIDVDPNEVTARAWNEVFSTSMDLVSEAMGRYEPKKLVEGPQLDGWIELCVADSDLETVTVEVLTDQLVEVLAHDEIPPREQVTERVQEMLSAAKDAAKTEFERSWPGLATRSSIFEVASSWVSEHKLGDLRELASAVCRIDGTSTRGGRKIDIEEWLGEDLVLDVKGLINANAQAFFVACMLVLPKGVKCSVNTVHRACQMLTGRKINYYKQRETISLFSERVRGKDERPSMPGAFFVPLRVDDLPSGFPGLSGHDGLERHFSSLTDAAVEDRRMNEPGTEIAIDTFMGRPLLGFSEGNQRVVVAGAELVNKCRASGSWPDQGIGPSDTKKVRDWIMATTEPGSEDKSPSRSVKRALSIFKGKPRDYYLAMIRMLPDGFRFSVSSMIHGYYAVHGKCSNITTFHAICEPYAPEVGARGLVAVSREEERREASQKAGQAELPVAPPIAQPVAQPAVQPAVQPAAQPTVQSVMDLIPASVQPVTDPTPASARPVMDPPFSPFIDEDVLSSVVERAVSAATSRLDARMEAVENLVRQMMGQSAPASAPIDTSEVSSQVVDELMPRIQTVGRMAEEQASRVDDLSDKVSSFMGRMDESVRGAGDEMVALLQQVQLLEGELADTKANLRALEDAPARSPGGLTLAEMMEHYTVSFSKKKPGA